MTENYEIVVVARYLHDAQRFLKSKHFRGPVHSAHIVLTSDPNCMHAMYGQKIRADQVFWVAGWNLGTYWKEVVTAVNIRIYSTEELMV